MDIARNQNLPSTNVNLVMHKAWVKEYQVRIELTNNYLLAEHANDYIARDVQNLRIAYI